jgi:methionine-rich copper-binding protein CopC
MIPSLWTMIAAAGLALAAGCGDSDGTSADTALSDTMTDAIGGDTVVADTVVADTAVADSSGDVAVADTAVADTAVADTAVADTAEADVVDLDALGPIPAVVINEVAAEGDPADWIELYNADAVAVDLAGWRLRDDDEAHGYDLPAGTTLEPGAYLVVERGDAGFDFGLGGADAALLYDAAGRLADATVWLEGESPVDGSWGRFPNGTGDFSTRYAASKGGENLANPEVPCGDGAINPSTEVCDGAEFGGLSCEAFGWGGGELTCADGCTTIDQSACTAHAVGLVINEVTSAGDDLVELFNGGATAVDLAGWSIHDDADNTYVFPAGVSVAAGAYLVLTKGVDHDFGLGGDDAVTLSDASAAVIDVADWQDGEALLSYCRWPDGVGGFRACVAATFGAANQGE